MIYTTEIPHLEQGVRSAVTLGKFDGLHRGHQKLIHCISEKRREDCRAVVFTFDVSPRSYILKVPPKFLLTYEERRELAEERGVDILAECPFTEELMHMEPEQFVKEYLVERLHAEYLAVGPDFRFGHKREGNPQMLQKLGKEYGFTVEIVEKDGKVGGIVLKNVNDGTLTTLTTSAVFPYIGADPCTEFARALPILDERGYVIVNDKMETACRGIYGAGDVTVKNLRQVVTAANDGAIAAQQAFHQLKG